MSVLSRSYQAKIDLVELLDEEPEPEIRPDPEPMPEPEPRPTPEPPPLPEPIPEEVPGRRVPGREIEDPNGPWVPGPSEVPGQPEQPSSPPEVPPTIWPEQG